MKRINWVHVADLNDPMLNQVIKTCKAKNVYNILSLHKDWNTELIAQFYSTLWREGEGKDAIMHWMLEGKRFQVSYRRFTQILGFDEEDLNHRKLPDFNPPMDSQLDDLYDKKDGFRKYVNTLGMKSLFKYLNTFFWLSLAPRVRDKTNVHNINKTLLFAMGGDQESFSVFDFIWWKIVDVSQSGTKSLIYAPYIMYMMGRVFKIHFWCDSPHPTYRIHLPKKTSKAPSSSAGPSSLAPAPSTSEPPSVSGSQRNKAKS